MRVLATTVLGIGLMAAQLPASSFLYGTPSGAKDPQNQNPVDVTALFTFTNGNLEITVQNLETGISAGNQALSSMTFQLQGEDLTNVTVTGSAETVTIDNNRPGGYTVGSAINILANGIWNDTITSGTNTSIGFCDPNCSAGSPGPPYTLVGPPNALNEYTSNGSLSGPHNPHLYESMSFDLSATGLANAQNWNNTVITDVTFGFGTTPGDEVSGNFITPEPGGAFLIAAGLMLISIKPLSRRFKSRRG